MGQITQVSKSYIQSTVVCLALSFKGALNELKKTTDLNTFFFFCINYV